MRVLQDHIDEPKWRNQGQHTEHVETKKPFSIELLVTRISSKFHLPDMKSYEVTSDSSKYLETYQSLMELHGFFNATKCWFFHLTLTGIVWQWYLTLLPGTISTFKDLARDFISQFSVHKVHEKLAHLLNTVRQRENEINEAYLSHFVKEEMLIED